LGGKDVFELQAFCKERAPVIVKQRPFPPKPAGHSPAMATRPTPTAVSLPAPSTTNLKLYFASQNNSAVFLFLYCFN
jgi:hypothetical protein